MDITVLQSLIALFDKASDGAFWAVIAYLAVDFGKILVFVVACGLVAWRISGGVLAQRALQDLRDQMGIGDPGSCTDTELRAMRKWIADRRGDKNAVQG